VDETVKSGKEVYTECLPSNQVNADIRQRLQDAFPFIHIPYFPAFHRPGWLLRYVVGPHDQEMLDMFINDFIAGITVGLTLIPQGLSYAGLANMPAINGLYSAILPSAAYTFLGSSMQLAVGPVAVVSLLVGNLVLKYGTFVCVCVCVVCVCVFVIV